MATEFIQDETPLLASRQMLNGVLPYCVSFEEWTDKPIIDYHSKNTHAEVEEDKKFRNFACFFKFVPALAWVTSVMLNSSIYLSKEFLTKAFQLKRIMVHEIRGDIHHLMKCPAEIVTLTHDDIDGVQVLRSKTYCRSINYDNPNWRSLRQNKILVPSHAKEDVVPLLRVKTNHHPATTIGEWGGKKMSLKEFRKIEQEEFKPLRSLRHFMVPSLAELFDYKKFLERKGTPLQKTNSFKHPGTITRKKYSLGGWTEEAIIKGVVGEEEPEYELSWADRLDEEYWEKHR